MVHEVSLSELMTSSLALVESCCHTPSWATAVNESVSVKTIGLRLMLAITVSEGPSKGRFFFERDGRTRVSSLRRKTVPSNSGHSPLARGRTLARGDWLAPLGTAHKRLRWARTGRLGHPHERGPCRWAVPTLLDLNRLRCRVAVIGNFECIAPGSESRSGERGRFVAEDSPQSDAPAGRDRVVSFERELPRLPHELRAAIDGDLARALRGSDLDPLVALVRQNERECRRLAGRNRKLGRRQRGDDRG